MNARNVKSEKLGHVFDFLERIMLNNHYYPAEKFKLSILSQSLGESLKSW